MKNIFAPLLTFILFFHTQNLSAQEGIITGTVTDKIQKLSLPGASINLLPGNRYTIADEYGKFAFLDVPSGEYTISISYIGYKPLSQSVTLKAGSSTEVHLQLEDGASIGNEILVLGDRLRGQAKALNKQKNNFNITNVVSSDQIGRFPDANIGDAIKRIPGITMQNDQGEARNIIIRGMAPQLNSVTLNGDRIPSAEGDNRRIQMDLIPSDMIQTIEVNKTLTSDMDADAIGGSVNLITRAAPNHERISATLSSGYNPIRGKALYNGGLVYGNRFFDQKLGVVVSGSYNNNDYGSDNVEAVWKEDDFGNAYIEEQDIRKYDVKRVRRSFATALDFKFNNRNRISANVMYNWRDDWENRFRWRATDVEPEYDANDQIIGYTGAIRRQSKGGIMNNRVDGKRLEEQKVQNYSLRGDHLIGSSLNFDWGVSYSKASEYRPNERYIEYQVKNVSFDRNFDSPELPLLRPTTNLGLSDYAFRELTENKDELGIKLNFRIPFSLINDQKGRLRFGARLRLKNKNRNNNFIEYTPLVTNMESLQDAEGVNWDGKKWNPSSKYVPGTFASRRYLGNLPLTNTTMFEADDVPDEYLAVNYNAKESIIAGYARWDQSITNQLTMILGLRTEITSIKYEGNIIEDESNLEGKRKISNSYINLLPSVTFKYDVNKDFIVRAAATTSLARPDYYILSPFVNTILDDSEISAGNPDLSSSYAWNLDLMGEYYFKSVGIISGGVFYKNIKNFIYTYRDESFTNAKFAEIFPDLPNPVPTGENWTLTQARNGENVSVYGFEVAVQRQLDFLPGKFLKGFGVYTNYTYTKSSAKGIYNEDGELREGISLPGTAPHMFNASLSWENKKFSARVSLNYAAAYLDELGGGNFEDRYYDKQVFLDANASYAIIPTLRVFAEANNLTNQALRYYQGISARTMQMEYYQPRFNAGFKFDLSR